MLTYRPNPIHRIRADVMPFAHQNSRTTDAKKTKCLPASATEAIRPDGTTNCEVAQPTGDPVLQRGRMIRPVCQANLPEIGRDKEAFLRPSLMRVGGGFC